LLFWLVSPLKTSPEAGFGTAGQSRCGGKTKSNRQLTPIETSSVQILLFAFFYELLGENPREIARS
jgi:hypothetical protein